MAYCPECGEEVRSGASFCESCGSPLEKDPTEENGEKDASDPPATRETDEGISSENEGLNGRRVGAATGFGLAPAFGAYMLVSLAAYDPVVIAFLVAIPAFGYLLYRHTGKRDMASGMFFWLAIEGFLLPVAAIFYTVSYSEAETATAAGEAGAAIGGGILTIMAFVIGLPIGVVFYLISSRLEP